MKLYDVKPRTYRLHQPDRRWRELVAEAPLAPALKYVDQYDPLRREAGKFIQAWERTQCADRDKIRKKYPDLMHAYLLYGGNNDMKWILEGGLTAGADEPALIAYTGLSAPVIKTYMYLFYDVKERLQDPAWLLKDLLPYVLTGDAGLADQDREYKMLGCSTGWTVLKDFIGYGPVSETTRALADKQISPRLLAALTLAVRLAKAPAKDQTAAARFIQTAQEIADLYTELGSNEFIPFREAMNALAQAGAAVLRNGGVYYRR
jgi:hypothetical protein